MVNIHLLDLKKNQPLTTAMSKDKYTCLYRLGLKSKFLKEKSPF